jgi:hypothetical protein
MERTFHTTMAGDDRRVRWVFDDDYDPEGAWALDTEEETAREERRERDGLERGDLIALVAIPERRCCTCECWRVDDDALTVGGCVYDWDANTTDTLDADAPEFMGAVQ